MPELYGRDTWCHLVRINAPEWYEDPEWLAWLNDPRTATWHIPGEEPGECSDVMFTYGGPADGSDYGGENCIPDHIWDQIVELVEEHTGSRHSYCLVWVSNLAVHRSDV